MRGVSVTGLVLLSVPLVGAVLVWIDANQPGYRGGLWWALGTLLLLIVFLPSYMIYRSRHAPRNYLPGQ